MLGISRCDVAALAFAGAWPDEASVQGPLAQLTWYRNLAILEKVAGRDRREWYVAKAIEQGWSRNVLALQIEGRLFERFLLELGAGFALVGSQYHLQVGDSDFFIDLLFYHTRLRCYVVVDLKMGRFTPADAGQLNFYLSAADDLLQTEGDGPTIGLLLCRGRDETVAEHALGDVGKPMGTAVPVSSSGMPGLLTVPAILTVPPIAGADGPAGGPVADRKPSGSGG